MWEGAPLLWTLPVTFSLTIGLWLLAFTLLQYPFFRSSSCITDNVDLSLLSYHHISRHRTSLPCVTIYSYTCDMPRSQVSNYIWTPKRDLLLLRMRDGPGHYTWEETVERLGPTCHVPGAMNRHGCLQRGMVGTDPWDERKEQELVRLLATGYTIFAIQVMMRLPLYFIRRRIVIVKENAEQAALEVKQRQFLDKPLQWGGREDEVLLRLDIALMEPPDIQLLGLFGKITLTFIRERIALHRDPRSELYRRLLELYNRRLGIERITRWTIEDVLNGHFEFLVPLSKHDEKAADENRRRYLYEEPREWTIKEDEVLLRFFLAGMEPSTMDRMAFFGKPGQSLIRERIARHYNATTPLCATLHQEYNDHATTWTSQDVLHLKFDFKVESTTTNIQDNGTPAEAEEVDDSFFSTWLQEGP